MAGQVHATVEGALVLIGFGSIGRGVLPLIERHIGFDRARLTVIEPSGEFAQLLAERGIRHLQLALTAENFAEVLSIGSTLLNHDGAPHVRLYGSYPPGENPPADIAGLLHGLGRRLDLQVTISGYGTGTLSVVRAF